VAFDATREKIKTPHAKRKIHAGSFTTSVVIPPVRRAPYGPVAEQSTLLLPGIRSIVQPAFVVAEEGIRTVNVAKGLAPRATSAALMSQ
jgi:hypothetical protein